MPRNWPRIAIRVTLRGLVLLAPLVLFGCGDEVTQPEVVSSPTSISGPSNPFPNVSGSFCATGSVSSTGNSVEYQLDWGDDRQSCWADTCQHSAWTTPGTYCVKARARSQGDRTIASDWTACYLVTVRTPPETITIPESPTGPAELSPGVTGEFCGTSSTSSLGHTVEYRFEWTDGNLSPWSTTCQNHPWTTPGSYCVRVQARCATDTDMLSPWSECGNVLVLHPDETVSLPSTPTGPSKVGLGTSGEFCTGGSTSSKGHAVTWRFDWGNGARSSWGSSCRSYSWPSPGTYCVMAEARCATDTTAVSHWSPCRTVTVPPLYSLHVESGNPSSGVRMKIESPGVRHFNAPYDTTLEVGTSVTLACPGRAGGHLFYRWSENGQQAAVDTTFSFVISENHNYLAEYWALALSVDTDPPGLNAQIALAPPDDYGRTSTVTPGRLSYESGTSVDVTAPWARPAYNFVHWTENGQVISEDRTLPVQMMEEHDLVAVYRQVPTYVLTVTSNGPVTVTVSPADNNGNAMGTTPAEFVYNEGAQVAVSAAYSITRKWASGGTIRASFVRWCPGSATNRTRTVVMTESQTLHAVYPAIANVVPFAHSWCGWCCARVTAGDQDFLGKGPYVKFDLQLESPNPSTLNARLWMWARAYDGIYPNGSFLESTGEATCVWEILRLTDGSEILTWKSLDCARDPLYVDYTTQQIDCYPGPLPQPCTWIKKLCIQSDTDGYDLSSPTSPCGTACNWTGVMTVEWNPVEYLAIPPPCD